MFSFETFSTHMGDQWVFTSTFKKYENRNFHPLVYSQRENVSPKNPTVHCDPPIPTPVVVPMHLDVPSEQKSAAPPVIDRITFSERPTPPIFLKGGLLKMTYVSWKNGWHLIHQFLLSHTEKTIQTSSTTTRLMLHRWYGDTLPWCQMWTLTWQTHLGGSQGLSLSSFERNRQPQKWGRQALEIGRHRLPNEGSIIVLIFFEAACLLAWWTCFYNNNNN